MINRSIFNLTPLREFHFGDSSSSSSTSFNPCTASVKCNSTSPSYLCRQNNSNLATTRLSLVLTYEIKADESAITPVIKARFYGTENAETGMAAIVDASIECSAASGVDNDDPGKNSISEVGKDKISIVVKSNGACGTLQKKEPGGDKDKNGDGGGSGVDKNKGLSGGDIFLIM